MDGNGAQTQAAHDDRVAELRSRLDVTDRRAALIHGRANIRYLTGFDGGGATPYLVVTEDDLRLVHYTADEDTLADWGEQLQLVPYSPDGDATTLLGRLLASVSTPVLVDASWWTAAERDALCDVLGEAVGDCSHSIAAMRAVKSEWEQEQLRRAGRITAATMTRLEALAENGAMPSDLAAAYYETSLARGAGPSTSIPYFAVGDAALRNHTTWDWHARAARAPESCGPYLFEFATTVNGYACPLSRSRSDHPNGARAVELLHRTVDDAIARMQPEVPMGEVYRQVHAAISGAGHRFSHRAGYSIGLGEAETWMEPMSGLLGPGDPRPLAAGMAFHVVTSIVSPGEFGVAHSHSVLVREDGCEVLTR